MNINEIKAFMHEKPAHLGEASSVQNKLRDAGLEQAQAMLGDKASLSDKGASKSVFAAQVLMNSMSHSVSLGLNKPEFRAAQQTEQKEESKGLFDFEEVARNVLNFVGGAVKNAKNNGADEEALNSLLEQARAGVLKGIGMAEKDLAGIMNDDIKTGIRRSQELIDTGLQKLRESIFGETQEASAAIATKVALESQVNYERRDSGELRIRTLDGDEVMIRFEDLESFEFNQKLLKEVEEEQIFQRPVEPTKPDVVNTTENNIQNDVNKEPVAREFNTAGDTVVAEENNATNTHEASRVTSTERYEHFNSNVLSFTVQGELDEDELNAIGTLVADASDLADEFFNGDIESAFNQALKLGYDEKELTGFALQLTRQEQTQSIQAYESVSHFSEDDPRGDPNKTVKPVAHYLDKMLDVFEQSRQKLESGEQYDDLINGLINQMGEVHTPDLISAIQRFHSFNQKLLNGLPLNFSEIGNTE
ncbi:MAG: chemotaxis protein CheA [Alteromonadaceae bacterium]|uniref:DUF5610 domain-containing protein n=1 Tax=Paraglaciecola chathamensis TaxID=368405 RepID=UPI000C3B081F|nr:DUF5610 domain-containing protein [Paraglaciecola agarilytica]MBN27174.1 chemotaxis protein CheA [Alteromonadaceae bacterium]|tara:strand:+ start:63066 stop:64496 length:1431 start_codon:yes stop_codon:yes gene_type:complete